jgi:hypothetical protein
VRALRPAFILLALPAATAIAGAATARTRPSAARGPLEREVTRLRRELSLAQGTAFYLRLDARTMRLSLVLGGVPLQEHALDAFEIGRPRVAFVPRSAPAGWDLQTYAAGRLEPARERDRIEVVAPAPSPSGDEAALEPSPPAIPPTAEEAYSVPSRYRIVFAGGVTVEVTARGGGRNRGLLRRGLDAVGLRLADLHGALRSSEEGRVSVRLRMAAEDAAALYRALPPDVGLVVVGLASP